MDKLEKEQKKLQKKKEKARAKRYKKINNGLDICMIAFCFLVCLISALPQIWKKLAERPAKPAE